MEYSKINIRTWSMLGKRGTFGVALTDFAPQHDDMMAITADFTKSSGLDRFSKIFPEKYLTVGIAEQNLIGIASGLASEGFNVFATSFASFITTRCYEQVKIHCGYMHHNLKVVGLASGFGVEQQGNTHYGLDDICLMRNIPGLTIVSPADSTEVVKAVEALASFDGPAYLRLCGESGDPIVNKSDYSFQIGKGIVLQEGSDVLIVATGTMVYQSLQDTMTEGKALDEDVEGFVNGGLGTAVAEVLIKENIVIPMQMIGLSDFPHAGSYKYMLSETGLDSVHIAETISQKLNCL